MECSSTWRDLPLPRLWSLFVPRWIENLHKILPNLIIFDTFFQFLVPNFTFISRRLWILHTLCVITKISYMSLQIPRKKSETECTKLHKCACIYSSTPPCATSWICRRDLAGCMILWNLRSQFMSRGLHTQWIYWENNSLGEIFEELESYPTTIVEHSLETKCK